LSDKIKCPCDDGEPEKCICQHRAGENFDRCEECGVIEDLTNNCCDRCHNRIYGTTY